MVKNKITLNVLADISKKINNGGYTAPSNNILIIFNGSNIGLDSRILELKNLKEKDFNLSIGFSFMAKGIIATEEIINRLNPMEVYKEEDVFNLEDIIEKYPRIIMPNLTMNTLSKVALGMVDSFASNILWAYLYCGKEVYLDFNSVNNYLGKSSGNQAINSLINNHIKTIKDMGAIEIGEGNYIEKIIGENPKNTNEKSGLETNKEFNKVITERDLYNLSKDSVLKLPKGTIITPLARDRARELGIKIEIER